MTSTSHEHTIADLLSDAPNNWGKWGPDDEVGSLNYLTPDEVLRGVQNVRQGRVITLQLPMCDPKGAPVWPGRRDAEHFMVSDEGSYYGDSAPQLPGGVHVADDVITAFVQASTQYDALGHVWFDGEIYNGSDAKTTIGGLSKASIRPIAERGVVGRGLLLDMARFRGVSALSKGDTFTHEDLEACAAAQGETIEKRDILIIRTGFLTTFYEVGAERFYENLVEPGLTYSPALAQWFKGKEVPNLVTDTFGNEVTYDPTTGVAFPLHGALMRNLGVAFTEVCDLEALAKDCAADGQWAFLYAAAPLKITAGTGAPVNPLAVK